MTTRRTSHSVFVGTVGIGSQFPIRIQSMTNTDTADVQSTVNQIIELHRAGSELVRVTVNTEAAAQAVPEIKAELVRRCIEVPLIGDFHFNGHVLLRKYAECARALDKYRINPGNVGSGILHDQNFAQMIAAAVEYNKPVRIGVNWGSLDQELLTRNMNSNALSGAVLMSEEVVENSLVESAIVSAQYAEKCGLARDKIIVAIKASEVGACVRVNQKLARECEYPIHLGLTEAGVALPGAVASTAALAQLLAAGIGDTIRVSLTPSPTSPRSHEVVVARLILESLGLAHYAPRVTSCPGCGRTENAAFQKMTAAVNDFVKERIEEWKKVNPKAPQKKIAVMGCVVNGPGESRHADIALSFPGKSEDPRALVFIDGKMHKTLLGSTIEADFLQILDDYFLQTQSY